MQKWPSAEELRPYRGMWVGLSDGHVVLSSGDVVAIVNKMRMLRIELDALFRVPEADD